jgi:transposase-like protein
VFVSTPRLSVEAVQRVAFARSRYGGTADALARRARVTRAQVQAILALFAERATARGRLSTYSALFARAVVRDYRAGVPVAALYTRYEISRSTLFRMLDASSEPRRGSVAGLSAVRRRRPAHPAATRRAAVAAYVRGAAVSAINARYDVGSGTLLRWVEDAGMPLRVGRAPHGPSISAPLAAIIVHAYDTTPVPVLCARYRRQGLSPARLRGLLRAAGVPLKRGPVKPDPVSLVRAVAGAARRGARELELKQQFRVGAARLRRLLAAAGVSLTQRQRAERAWSAARQRQLVEAWGQGASLRQLRRRFGAAHATVVRELLRVIA